MIPADNLESVVTSFILWLFGSAFGGAALGWLVSYLARTLVPRFRGEDTMQLGLAVGLLAIGTACALHFFDFFAAYRDFATRQPRFEGQVMAVIDRPSERFGGTSPVPLVEFEHEGQRITLAARSGGSGHRPGDRVTVLYDPADPERARFGQPGEARGGMIAALLFGTFPLTLGIYFLAGTLTPSTGRPPRTEIGREPRRQGGRNRGERRAAQRVAQKAAQARSEPVASKANAAASGRRARMARDLIRSAYLGMFLGLVGAGVWAGIGAPVERALFASFAAVSVGLWALVLGSLVDPQRSKSQAGGIAVLAINFSVWTSVLWYLFVQAVPQA